MSYISLSKCQVVPQQKIVTTVRKSRSSYQIMDMKLDIWQASYINLNVEIFHNNRSKRKGGKFSITNGIL